MKANKTILGLSLLMAALIAFVSIVGITNPATYAQETPNWQAQSIGQDMADLFLAVPFLIISSILLFRGSKKAVYVWGGTHGFLLYTFAIYCFDIHFSSLFVPYCIIFGLAFYLFLYFLYEHVKHHIIKGFGDYEEAKITGIYFISIAIIFYGLWLLQVIPPIKTGKPTQDLVEVGLITNPVHVLDLSVCLPAFFIVGVMLLKKYELGYALAPAVLTFSVLMDLNIGSLMLYMHSIGIDTHLGIAGIMALLSAISMVLLVLTIKNLQFDEDFK